MPRSLTLVALVLAACPPPGPSEYPPFCEPATQICPPTTGSSSTGDPESTSLPTGGIQTVTGPPTSSSTADAGETTTTDGSSSTSGPVVPAVVDVEFDPQPLMQAGSIHVDVFTKNTSMVEMKLEDGSFSALTPGPGGLFTGEIEVFSGLQNGERTAIFTPSNGQDVGAEDPRLYEVDLPELGTGAWWDASPDVGKGEVRAVRVTSTHIFEFGSHQDGGLTQCYLRRRDLFGKYGDGDIVPVLPGKTCSATDLAVGPGDELYLLANVTVAGQTRWWTGEMTVWGQTTKIDEGNAGEIANALAVAPDGAVVTCGAAPTVMKDLDAQYSLTYAGGFGWTRSFDYWPAEDMPHSFDETITDCEFAGDKLVMVGDAFGRHDKDDLTMRRRLALFEVDVHTDEHLWTVADAGPGDMTQSAGTALAIDDEGNFIVGLYTSKDKGGLVGEVRIFEPDGKLAELPLALGNDIAPPFAVAWSPGGYFVLASAKGTGWDTEFFVEAYFPGEPSPIWTYSMTEGVGLHLARTLGFVPGVVIAGGIGGAGYPALAFIYG